VSQPASSPAPGRLTRLTLEAPGEVGAGSALAFRLVLSNDDTMPVVLYLRGREPTFDLRVSGAGGEVVWERLAGAQIQAIIRAETLEPGARREFADRWPLVDRRGLPVAPGEYVLEGALLTDAPEPLRTAPRPLRVTP